MNKQNAKPEKAKNIGHFLIESKADADKLAKYVVALKEGNTLYKPQLKKVETKKAEVKIEQKKEEKKGDGFIWE